VVPPHFRRSGCASLPACALSPQPNVTGWNAVTGAPGGVYWFSVRVSRVANTGVGGGLAPILPASLGRLPALDPCHGRSILGLLYLITPRQAILFGHILVGGNHRVVLCTKPAYNESILVAFCTIVYPYPLSIWRDPLNRFIRRRMPCNPLCGSSSF
jgi:hypothetical protein